MGGSRKEAILFERAVTSGATEQTSFSAIANKLNKSCDSAHVGTRYHY